MSGDLFKHTAAYLSLFQQIVTQTLVKRWKSSKNRSQNMLYLFNMSEKRSLIWSKTFTGKTNKSYIIDDNRFQHNTRHGPLGWSRFLDVRKVLKWQKSDKWYTLKMTKLLELKETFNTWQEIHNKST